MRPEKGLGTVMVCDGPSHSLFFRKPRGEKRERMCPHTAPISRAGKAAASAAGRLLRAFEAELAPVVEAISPGAMVRRLFPWPPSLAENSIDIHLCSRFHRSLQGGKGSSWLLQLGESTSVCFASSGGRSEEDASSCAEKPATERRAFFSIDDVARRRSLDSLAGVAVVTPPHSLPLFLRRDLFPSSLPLRSLFISRAKELLSRLVLTWIKFSNQKKRERLPLAGTPRREPGQPPSSSVPAPAGLRSAKALHLQCAPRGGLQRSTGGARRSPGVEANASAAGTVAAVVAATELLPREERERERTKTKPFSSFFVCFSLSLFAH